MPPPPVLSGRDTVRAFERLGEKRESHHQGQGSLNGDAFRSRP
jgi:hypothetical protein